MPISDEQRMWRAVVLQALEDLFAKDYWEQRDAVCWFFDKNVDFNKVCDFAGFSPQYVRKKALEQIINGR